MDIVLSGFVLGLMGSFHCAGMCGPIALALPLNGNNNAVKVTGGVLYNLGRSVTYALMGAVFGLVGQGLSLVGFQKWVSVAMGVLMIISVLVPSLFKKVNSGKIPFAGAVRKGIQRLFAKKSFGGLFFIGLLNGLLPCGLVYVAIAGAIGAGGVAEGALFMLLFGLGTLPLMLAISILGNMMSLSVRNKMNKVIPVMVVVIGLIFVLRGLSLGIPYLSPPESKLSPAAHSQVDTKEAVDNSCCH
ncbi:sulfite exporter TauE/SafE family protein [Saccharicrinis aurantiacus]|uniref:sulfite exporter TauE/SafE family protein n=1 Tax=Saccharicrinis aurantiacus TaxID=1849719 RepID=UPI0024928B53|nr:sulfite exporter TauE/SafE family protein [Saccharicrinis aurantiacus]